MEDANDAFPLDPEETLDTDGDTIGNNADTDDDNDGVEDANDAFPLDPEETLDIDGDTIGNNADTDDDMTALRMRTTRSHSIQRRLSILTATTSVTTRIRTMIMTALRMRTMRSHSIQRRL